LLFGYIALLAVNAQYRYLIIFNIDTGAIYLEWGLKGKISNWDLIVLTLLVSVRLGVRFFHNSIDEEWRCEFNNNY